MTPERLSELRALCDAATGIQWHPNPVPALERYGVTTENEDGTMRALVMLNPNFPHNHEHDAAFIASARQALPEALDEIERLTKALEQACRLARLDAFEAPHGSHTLILTVFDKSVAAGEHTFPELAAHLREVKP